MILGRRNKEDATTVYESGLTSSGGPFFNGVELKASDMCALIADPVKLRRKRTHPVQLGVPKTVALAAASELARNVAVLSQGPWSLGDEINDRLNELFHDLKKMAEKTRYNYERLERKRRASRACGTGAPAQPPADTQLRTDGGVGANTENCTQA